jgi:hypothetical protein
LLGVTKLLVGSHNNLALEQFPNTEFDIQAIFHQKAITITKLLQYKNSTEK